MALNVVWDLRPNAWAISGHVQPGTPGRRGRRM